MGVFLNTNYKFIKTIILLFFITIGCNVFSQNYTHNVDAYDSTDNWFILTPDLTTKRGTVWYNDKLNLNEKFDIEFLAYFGWRNDNTPGGYYYTGADGIVFALQQAGSTYTGTAGDGIGYQGTTPSLGIEFDTWQNTYFSDPVNDHTAILRNGVVDHAQVNTLIGPVQASYTNADIEDSTVHYIRITWDPAYDSIKVFFDCYLRMALKYDIITNIFPSDPNVWWGFTSGTGGARNRHMVRLTETIFVTENDTAICKGDTIQIDASKSGGDQYVWSPDYGISNDTIYNPLFYPETTTTYYLNFKDFCNTDRYDTITVDVSTIVPLNIPDASVCEGEAHTFDAGAGYDTYDWSNGSNSQSIMVSNDGKYRITVTDGICDFTDTVDLTVFPLPDIDFTGDTLTGCEELTVNFTDNTGGSLQSWEWDFGDGNSSSQQNPSHIYSAGTYDVTLTVTTSDNCSDIYTINNMIDAYLQPDASFVADPEITPVSQPVISFINNSSNGQTWLWDFGDGSTSTEESCTHTYSSAGTYNVCLYASTSNGCNDSYCFEVMVIEDSLTIPNVITPNGDAVNDYFKITNIENYISSHMIIFDRWGKKVYEADNYNNSTVKWAAEKDEDGVYYYVLTYHGYLKDGGISGTITVLR